MRNTTKILNSFWDAVDDAEAKAALEPYYMLCLDCSKGYNNLDQTWLLRCLDKAELPRPLRKLVRALLVIASVLLLNGVEYEPLEFVTGLTQGCPA